MTAAPAQLRRSIPAVPHASTAVRRTAVAYLVLQALATATWWGWMFISPQARLHFWPRDWPVDSVAGSAVSDSLIIVASLVSAGLVARRHSSASASLWLTLGTVAYPSVSCITVAIRSTQAIAAAVAMGAATFAILIVALAFEVSRRESMLPVFQFARSGAPHRVHTFLQICVFWPVLLVLLPWVMSRLDLAMGWSHFGGQTLRIAAVLLFVGISLINLWAAWVMTSKGDGTPFPYRMTRKLVIEGPYRFIRNPMAMTGLLQGIAASIFLGSWLAILYVVCGGLIWQSLVRPIEEQMLFEVFGDDYAAYRARVPCRLPRLKSSTET